MTGSHLIGTKADMPEGIYCHKCGRKPQPGEVVETEVRGIRAQIFRCSGPHPALTDTQEAHE